MFGTEVVTARSVLGLSIKQAADLAGVSWQTQARAEAGAPGLSIRTMGAIGEAVGLDVVLKTYPGRTLALRDTGQLRLAQQLCADAVAAWQATIELRIGQHGDAIDLVLFGINEIIAIETERAAIDWQAQYRRADAKRAVLAAQHQRPVRLVMAVEDSRRNRRALAPHAEVIRLAQPARSREVLRSIRHGQPLGRDGLLWVRRRSAIGL